MTESAERVWSIPGLRERIVSFVPSNDVACKIRLLNREAAAVFRGTQHNTIHLSQPCPLEVFKGRWGIPGALRPLTLKKRHQLVCLTAASRVLANLEVAFESSGCAPDGKMLEAAAAAGDIESCQWLHERGCPWGKALAAAAEAGKREVCEWLLDNGYFAWEVDAICAAARGGHLGLMEWLLQQKPASAPDYWHLVASEAHGFNLPTFQRLHTAGHTAGGTPLSEEEKEQIISEAAGSPISDWQEKVAWLQGEGYPLNWSACRAAAACSDAVERLLWLSQQGCRLKGSWALEALKGPCLTGDLALLQFLMSYAPTDEYPQWPTLTAAMCGHVAILQALHAAGRLPPDMVGDIVRFAAAYGQQPVLTWAEEALGYDPRSDPTLLESAARSGDVDLMLWAEERNGFRSTQLLEAVVSSGCEEALEFMLERGCFEATEASVAAELYTVAARDGDLATLRWLRDKLQGVGLSETLFFRSVRGSFPVGCLRWLVEEAGCCPADWGKALSLARFTERICDGDPPLHVRQWVLAEIERRRQGV